MATVYTKPHMPVSDQVDLLRDLGSNRLLQTLRVLAHNAGVGPAG